MQHGHGNHNFPHQGQHLADVAADRVQDGIERTRDFVDDQSDKAQDKVESLRSKAGPALDRAAQRATLLGREGIDRITDAAAQLKDSATELVDDITRYTRAKPLTALAIAAATGAVVATVISRLTGDED